MVIAKTIRLGLALGLLASLCAAAVPPVIPLGLWRNPDNSLQVRISECAAKLCGVIAWASEASILDARESKIKEPLVGTQLLIDYHRASPAVWKGQVYVPDLGGSFYSRITVKGPNTLDIAGCILGGLICKHQTWQRV